MGILDLVHSKNTIVHFLENQILASQKNLGDDLQALLRVAKVWDKNEPLDVGESGTLYRLLKFACWKLNLDKKFIISGTLKNRHITDNPSIVDLPLAELLKLDNGTSQWATAAVLLGSKEKLEKIDNPPYKLVLTYEAVGHWNSQNEKGEAWKPRYDQTITQQALIYLQMLKGIQSNFHPMQAEDYCFAYTFGYITVAEGEKLWPSLRGHESDRIEEMTRELVNAKNGREITSRDHRVVQAIAMWSKVEKRDVKILYPQSVNKSWPQFWDFIDYSLKKV